MNAELAEQSGIAANYAQEIRGWARGLWNGSLDYYQAYEGMDATVPSGLRRAWYEGARGCGIKPSEISPTERDTMRRMIDDERSRISGFLAFVMQNNKQSGAKFRSGIVASRLSMWALGYTNVVNRARVDSCADQKLEWVHNALGVTKEPCNTCLNKLAGKVKRGSYWKRVGVRPQNRPNPFLDCEGWG